MSGRISSAILPIYIFLCILLGGSSQGVWGNLILQLLGLALIVWTLVWPSAIHAPPAARMLLLILAGMVALVLVQIVPLPPAVWSAFPGRDFAVDGYRLLGFELPARPTSLTPHDTVATGLALIPPAAVLLTMLYGGNARPAWLFGAVLAGTFLAILLGALQVGGPASPNSPWYLYERTNYGFGTGFFANSNHMGALLAVSLALLFGLVTGLRSRSKSPRTRSSILLAAAGGVLVLLVGIYLNGSLAVLLLAGPVLTASLVLIAVPERQQAALVGAVAIVSVAGAGIVYLTPIQDALVGSNLNSFQERAEIWSTLLPAIQQHWLTGSGIGSFRDVYPLFEDPSAVGRTLTNHAHNDYLEIALEAGIAGILLVVLFLLWWVRRSAALWSGGPNDPFARAATIASAVLLLHSFVDYPLRTAALSSIFAMLVALMAQPRQAPSAGRDDLWPTRHESI